MFGVSELIWQWGGILTGGAVLCLLLEVVGTPIGFRKIGKRPHIAALALLLALVLGIYFFFYARDIDSLAHFSICLCSVVSVFSIGLAIPQMRHMDHERGEAYALLLIALLTSVVLCTIDNIVHLATCATVWFSTAALLIAFRGTKVLTAEIAAKLIFFSTIVLLFLTLAAALAFFATGDTGFSELAASSNTNIVAKTALAFTFVSLLFFLGAFPFCWFHVDYLDGAPSFAAATFFASGLIGGGVILSRLIDACRVASVLEGPLTTSLFLFAALSLFVPSVLGLDQQRVGRMCVYLLISQVGLIICGAFLPQSIQMFTNTNLMLIFSNLAIATPGLIGGLNFWKTSKNAEKTWEEYAGGGRKYPVAACSWIIILASLAGIPGTLGFVGRLTMIEDAIHHGHVWLAICLVLSIVICSVPVVRLAIFLFAKPTTFELLHNHQPRQLPLIILCSALIFIGGFIPGIILQLIKIQF